MPYHLQVQLGRVHRVDYCLDNKQPFYRMTAKLTNTSNDMLSYADWYCSHAVWSTDNPSVKVYEANGPCYVCEKNVITVFDVPPHQTKTMIMALTTNNQKLPTQIRLRIGITLIEASMGISFNHDPGGFDRFIKSQKQHRIWSNVVTLP